MLTPRIKKTKGTKTRIKTIVLHKLITSDKSKKRKAPIVVGLSLASSTDKKDKDSSVSVKPTAIMSRTNLRQQLMREQVEQEKKIEQQLTQNLLSSSSSSVKASSISVSHSLPLTSVELPKEVLQIGTKLENPTKYHVQQNQNNHVNQYLINTQKLWTIPLQLQCENEATTSPSPLLNSCDPSPTSSHSVDPSSSATSLNTLDGLWNGLLEEEMDADLNFLHIESSTVPLAPALSEVLKLSETFDNNNKVSTSCPPDLNRIKQEPLSYSEVEIQALAKDRQKKDNHNMIERRRRFNINDRIKELGTLLPKANDLYYDLVKDQRQNKGSILKATVDYMRHLKHDIQKISMADEKNRQLEKENKRLLLRIQDLEIQLKNYGIPIQNSTWQPSSTADLNALMQTPLTVTTTESFSTITNSNLLDAKHDSSSPSPSSVLSSAPSASPAAPFDDFFLDDEMNNTLLHPHNLRKDLCFTESIDLMS